MAEPFVAPLIIGCRYRYAGIFFDEFEHLSAADRAGFALGMLLSTAAMAVLTANQPEAGGGGGDGGDGADGSGKEAGVQLEVQRLVRSTTEADVASRGEA